MYIQSPSLNSYSNILLRLCVPKKKQVALLQYEILLASKRGAGNRYIVEKGVV